MSELDNFNTALGSALEAALGTSLSCTIDLPTVAGKSAYEVATEGGFVGSEAAWLDSLKGDQGEQGIQGIPGEVGATGSVDLASLIDYFLPVNTIISNFDPDFDPNIKYTGTTWVLHGEGKAVVGLSAQSGDPSWTKTVGNTHGSYTHTLTEDELPNFSLNINAASADGSGASRPSFNTLTDNAADITTSAIGANAPHNNVQPSLVEARWRRTA